MRAKLVPPPSDAERAAIEVALARNGLSLADGVVPDPVAWGEAALREATAASAGLEISAPDDATDAPASPDG